MQDESRTKQKKKNEKLWITNELVEIVILIGI